MLLKGSLMGLAVVAGLLTVIPEEGRAQDIFKGHDLYETHCARCHGGDGFPIFPGTPDFTRGDGLIAPDGQLVRSIKDGKGLMPAFDGVISDQDILDVVSYTRSLQR